MDELVSFQILVRGQVQGVGYRYFARQRAELHGVRGFVRNLPDGSVEVRAEGPAPAMAAFEAELKAGPQFGRVENADVIPTKARGYEQFEIR